MTRTALGALRAAPFLVLFAIALMAYVAPGEQMTVHTVDIRVDPSTGQFSFSLDPVLAKPGDHVEWNSESGDWSIQMVDKTPFAELGARGKRAEKKRLIVKPDAAQGRYKYTVAVAVGDDVFIADPEIIIGPR
jgi:plastocyanin